MHFVQNNGRFCGLLCSFNYTACNILNSGINGIWPSIYIRITKQLLEGMIVFFAATAGETLMKYKSCDINQPTHNSGYQWYENTTNIYIGLSFPFTKYNNINIYKRKDVE